MFRPPTGVLGQLSGVLCQVVLLCSNTNENYGATHLSDWDKRCGSKIQPSTCYSTAISVGGRRTSVNNLQVFSNYSYATVTHILPLRPGAPRRYVYNSCISNISMSLLSLSCWQISSIRKKLAQALIHSWSATTCLNSCGS
jgi:hypothetical protein